MFQPDHEKENGHPSDATLLQFQQGVLLPEKWLEVQSHLAACGWCQMRSEDLMPQDVGRDAAIVSLARIFAKEGIASSVPRVAPPSESFPNFETVVAYLEGTLSGPEVDQFEALMLRFSTLAQEVETLRALKTQVHSAVESQPIDASQRTQSVETIPPMIVKVGAETQVPKRAWWERWLWPIQSLGTAAVMAMLFFTFGISPLQQELLNQQAELGQRETQLQSRNQQLRSHFETRTQNLENWNRQLQSQNHAAQEQVGAAQSQLSALKTQVSQQRSQIALLKEVPPAQKTDEPALSATPLSPSTPTFSAPLLSDGNGLITKQGKNYLRFETLPPEAVAALHEGTLPPSPSLAGLRSVATGSRGNLRFKVLSPVATKVRDLRPKLLWEKVRGATLYRISVSDETSGEFIIESQPSTTPSWIMPQDLPRGHRFKWTVMALSNGRILAQAPQKPDLAARFEVLSEADSREVEKLLLAAGDSPLKRSLVLAHAGLQQEAQDNLNLLRKQLGKESGKER